MKSLSILPMFLLLAACLSAQEPDPVYHYRPVVVDNLVYLIDFYSEHKYGRTCLSDEKLDSVFMVAAEATDSLIQEDFRRYCDSLFTALLGPERPLWKDSERFQNRSRNFHFTSVGDDDWGESGTTGALEIRDGTFKHEIMFDPYLAKFDGPLPNAEYIEMARLYSVIKYFYPYRSAIPCELKNTLRESVWKLVCCCNSLKEEEAVQQQFVTNATHHGFVKSIRTEYWKRYPLFFHPFADEYSLAGAPAYKLPVRISYDSLSFVLDTSDCAFCRSLKLPDGEVPRLSRINDANIDSLFRTLQRASCPGSRSSRLGQECQRLSYSSKQLNKLEVNGTAYEVEAVRVGEIFQGSRGPAFEVCGRNAWLHRLTESHSVLDSVFDVVYGGGIDTLFLDFRDQYVSACNAVSCTLPGDSVFGLGFFHHLNEGKVPFFDSLWAGDYVSRRLVERIRAKHGERGYVVCVLVDSTVSAENELYAMLLQSQPRFLVKGSRTFGTLGHRTYHHYGFPYRFLIFPSEGIMYPDGRELAPRGLRIDVPYR